MKYKGFIIESEKVEEGGYSYLIYSEKNNWILADEWNECLKNKKETLMDCKITIDDYWENPKDYRFDSI